MSSRKHLDFISAVIFLAMSAYAIIEGFNYYQGIQARGDVPFYESPGFFPVIIGCGLFVCSVMLLVRSIKGTSLGELFSQLKNGSATFVKSPLALRALIGCLWMGLYVFVLLRNLGFVLSSILFLVVIMVFLQWRKVFGSDKKAAAWLVIKILLVSVISIVMTYVLFQTIFRVPLP